MYDLVGGDVYQEYDFMTIGELIDLCDKNPDKNFKFVGTDVGPQELSSWRGVYSLPAIEYDENLKNGSELSAQLTEDLGKEHYGYKGGEFTYYEYDEFYVANYGSSEEIKVFGVQIESDEVILLTKRDPY